jgi:hypothetical protein
VNIIKNERDPSFFMSKLLLKFQNILRNTTQVNNHWLGNRGGSLAFLVGTIINVLVMEIGWTDVGSGGVYLSELCSQ